MNEEFRAERERESYRGMIALFDEQIETLERSLLKSGELAKVPKHVLDEYATIKSEIDKLNAINERYDESLDLKEKKKVLAADLIE